MTMTKTMNSICPLIATTRLSLKAVCLGGAAAIGVGVCVSALVGNNSVSSECTHSAEKDDCHSLPAPTNHSLPLASLLKSFNQEWNTVAKKKEKLGQQEPLMYSITNCSGMPKENSFHFSTTGESSILANKDNRETGSLECDYVIIGHGKAGRSALKTLRRLDPTAEIVVIDPNDDFYSANAKTGVETTSRKNPKTNRQKSTFGFGSNNEQSDERCVNYLPTRATFIEHSQKLVHITPFVRNGSHGEPQPPQNSTIQSNRSPAVVHYRKSALIATGSRGAPPPDECIRHDAWSRILELRSTEFPIAPITLENGTNQSQLPQQELSPKLNATTTVHSNVSKPVKNIPIMNPPSVRSLSLMAASQGATVAVMGSGFEALELAASLALVSSSSGSASASSVNKNPSHQQQSDDDSKKVILIFGNAGPLSARVPRYLSAAISKRLRQNGVEVQDRSMTRYISMSSPINGRSNSSGRNEKARQLELYTVKSYDSLDTNRMLADLLIYSPSVDGLNGTAVLPTPKSNDPKLQGSSEPLNPLNQSSSTDQFRQHLPWSSLISPPLVTCFLDDGRIATNTEFIAASSLYAAGSVAKYPNARTGQADVAGGTQLSAELAGEVAACNMVRDGGIDRGNEDSKKRYDMPQSHIQECIPVWRSDVVPYLPSPNANVHDANSTRRDVEHATTLSLYSMGIHTLCVGRCDSEGMATHGFWWTNSNQRESSSGNNVNGSATNSNVNDSIKIENRSQRKNTIGPNAFMRRVTRRTTMQSNSTRGTLPVYGSGVVFYLDRSGNIQGVMLWGLPFSENPKNVESTINDSLVERMKDIIRSNGGIAIEDHSDKLANEKGVNIDANLLSYLHLSEESKFLASMAITGLIPESNCRGTRQLKNIVGRPLHRFTPWKPSELTNIGKMRRKDDLGHLAEDDDLFYSKSLPTSVLRAAETDRPPSLKRIYPMQGGVLIGSLEHALEKEREFRQLQLERSRPPKEEPLWLRRGEANRTVNMKEAMTKSFLHNMLQGQFSDGSDAVKQAPVPKMLTNAKDQWRTWTGTDGDETQDEQ